MKSPVPVAMSRIFPPEIEPSLVRISTAPDAARYVGRLSNSASSLLGRQITVEVLKFSRGSSGVSFDVEFRGLCDRFLCVALLLCVALWL